MDKIFDNKHLIVEIYLYKKLHEDNDDYEEQVKLINSFAEVANAINHSYNPAITLDFINKYYNGNGLFTPLKLDESEFPFTGQEEQVNVRCSNVIKTKTGKIIYRNAYSPKINHVYDINSNKEVPVFPDYIDLKLSYDYPIYITKGGCSTGNYISNVYIKESTINKYCFTPHPPISLPVSLEIENEFYRLSVDAREPKLKTISEYYDIEISKSDSKIDIRKYKKLKK